MFEMHPNFVPLPPNEIIWRYMSYTKFLACISGRALYFSRFDKLGDPFEGAYTHQQAIKYKLSEIEEKKLGRKTSVWELMNMVKYTNFLNCWHISPYESSLMWKGYCPSGEGIAIKSTYERLTKSSEAEKYQIIHVGVVNYIDYKKDLIPEGNMFFCFLHKRKYFESERELRAVAWILERNTKPLFNPLMEPFDPSDPKFFGLSFSVNLEELIDSIYLPPETPNWLMELTRNHLIGAGLKNVPVIKSGLEEKPS